MAFVFMHGRRCTAMYGTTFSQCHIFLGHKTVILFINVKLYVEMYGFSLLLVNEMNEVPISSHIWVASSTFKQL